MQWMSYSVQELEEKVRGALSGTSNRSAPGADESAIGPFRCAEYEAWKGVDSGGGDVIKIYYLFIYLFLLPSLNPKSYGRARVWKAPGRHWQAIEDIQE